MHKKFAITEKELKRAAMATGIGSGLSEEEWRNPLQQCTGKQKDLLSLGLRLDQPGGPGYYTTRRNLETEKEIFRKVEMGKGGMPGLSHIEAERHLKSLAGFPAAVMAQAAGEARPASWDLYQEVIMQSEIKEISS